LPRRKNESETNTLPDPEQNPLLNPLLAAHMGRWAEVYFTNPPEKRPEAIAELIRELESAVPTAEPAVPALAREIAEETGERARETEEGEERAPVAAAQPDAPPPETLRICGVCAYDNAVGQYFCGMCGASLRLPETHAPEVVEVTSSAGESGSAAHDSLGGRLLEYSREPEFSFAAGHKEPDCPLENDVPKFGSAPQSIADRSRLYVGIVLAVLVVLLVYMAGRGTNAISGKADHQSAPAQVLPPAPAAVNPLQQPSALPAAPPKAQAPASPEPTSHRSQETPRKSQALHLQPASHQVTAAASSSEAAGEPSAAEDLATAQKYLSGTQGLTRDSREAALWLWKAVGKGNPAATLALSDLYLRGDGVPKSCDQARLLLDAAARKGARTAAERLRNLQAFGCE
jgi:hypothetical protein